MSWQACPQPYRLIQRTGTIIALYTLLGIFGALACTVLGDKLGRRWTIFTAATVNLLGVILQASSTQLGQFVRKSLRATIAKLTLQS